MPHIDLNCDLGESFGAYTIGMDEKVIPFITSANVACGFHAGDPLVMRRTVALCKQSGAAVGAHPGFPDLQGFGRRQMKLTPAEAKACVQYQIGALKAFCDAAGVPLHHVKPHGALYNMADLFYKGQSLGAIAVYADGIRLDGNVRTVVGGHFALGYHADHAGNGFVLILNHGTGGSAGHKATIRAVAAVGKHLIGNRQADGLGRLDHLAAGKRQQHCAGGALLHRLWPL